MTRLAIATTGGDSPGMNAAIRAVVKHAIHHGMDVIGIRNGGLGLLRASEEYGDYFPLFSSSLANTLSRSGTILKSSRQSRFDKFVAEALSETVDAPIDLREDLTQSGKFVEELGRLAKIALDRNEIDALILIGGDSTSRAAKAVSKAYQGRLPVVVIPATIDNDIYGTSETIGFDSAVAMAVAQVDAIRETAAAMDRVFVVEVMGARRGYIAVDVAKATGAEDVLIPEITYTEEQIREKVRTLARRAEQDRQSAIVIVAEGAEIPLAGTMHDGSPGDRIMQYLADEAPDVEARLSILGHVLRGAPPTARTRNLAADAGGAAVDQVRDDLHALESSPHGSVCVPWLVAISDEGYLERVEIKKDTIREGRTKIVEVVERDISILGF